METLSALLAFCAGNSPVTGEFPTQRPVTQSVDVFFDLPLNKRLGKQWCSWWFETPSCPLWRHRNVQNRNRFQSVQDSVMGAIAKDSWQFHHEPLQKLTTKSSTHSFSSLWSNEGWFHSQNEGWFHSQKSNFIYEYKMIKWLLMVSHFRIVLRNTNYVFICECQTALIF